MPWRDKAGDLQGFAMTGSEWQALKSAYRD